MIVHRFASGILWRFLIPAEEFIESDVSDRFLFIIFFVSLLVFVTIVVLVGLLLILVEFALDFTLVVGRWFLELVIIVCHHSLLDGFDELLNVQVLSLSSVVI